MICFTISNKPWRIILQTHPHGCLFQKSPLAEAAATPESVPDGKFSAIQAYIYNTFRPTSSTNPQSLSTNPQSLSTRLDNLQKSQAAYQHFDRLKNPPKKKSRLQFTKQQTDHDLGAIKESLNALRDKHTRAYTAYTNSKQALLASDNSPGVQLHGWLYCTDRLSFSFIDNFKYAHQTT